MILVDIDSLKERIDKEVKEGKILDGWAFFFKVYLDDAPTIDAVEVVHGEWIEVDDYFIRCKCSICGWESHKYEDDVYGMPYCPNCGAKMKGTNDETEIS